METRILDLNRELAFLQIEHQNEKDQAKRFRIYWDKILPKKTEINYAVDYLENLKYA